MTYARSPVANKCVNHLVNTIPMATHPREVISAIAKRHGLKIIDLMPEFHPGRAEHNVRTGRLPGQVHAYRDVIIEAILECRRQKFTWTDIAEALRRPLRSIRNMAGLP